MSKLRVSIFLSVLIILIVGACWDYRHSTVDSGELTYIGTWLISLIVLFVVSFLGARHLHSHEELWSDGSTYVPSVYLCMKKAMGAICQIFFPYRGYCTRCRFPWFGVIRPHLTNVPNFLGEEKNVFFVLCETCFWEIPPEQRLRFYAAKYGMLLAEAHCHGHQLYKSEMREGKTVNGDWLNLAEAVLTENGKEQEEECPQIDEGRVAHERNHS